MAKKKPMSEDELASLVRSEIDDAVQYDTAEFSKTREQAIRYYNGEMPDLKTRKGRSEVTSHDVADTIGWILPGLMRVFLATDKIVSYQPATPKDEPFAAQASEYINYVFLTRCNGYRVIWDASHDSLLHRNGVVKHWWEKSDEKSKPELYTGLADDVFAGLVQDEGVEILAHSAEMGPDGTQYHDVKIRRAEHNCGSLKIVPVPPEEFLIERGARSIDEATFTAHRQQITRSDLVARGYDREMVDKIPPFGEADTDPVRMARDEDQFTTGRRDGRDLSRERVEIYECYLKCDYDGDGIAELRKVTYAGVGDEWSLLDNDEWDDEVPFSDLCGMPVPHRWQGRSIYDDTMDIQRIKTVLMRQTLDNLYATNNPQREVVRSALEEGADEELLNPNFGGLIAVKEAGVVRDLVVPFVAENSFNMLEYMDAMAEKRTGVSRKSAALDKNALTNQTATEAQLESDQAHSKVELIARNMAELGLKRLFRCLLRLVVKHQNVPDVIRLRDKFVTMLPSMWNPDMDVSIDIGLGAGSRDRDIAVLQGVMQKQELVMAQMGPDNPIAGLVEWRNAFAKAIESAGIKAPEQFAKEVTPESLQQWQQGQGDKPDPEQSKIQAQMQIEKAKLDSSMQLESAKANVQLQREQAQADADVRVKIAEMQKETEMNRQKMTLDSERRRDEIAFEQWKFAQQQQLKREELAQQRSLELLKLGVKQKSDAMNAQVKADGMAMKPAEGEEPGEGEEMQPEPDAFDRLALTMADVMGRHSAETARQLGEMLSAHTETLTRSLSAPKRVVRGPDGRAIGVETVN